MLGREQEKKVITLLLALFFGSVATLINSLALRFYEENFFGYLLVALSSAVNILIFYFAYVRYGGKRTVFALLIYFLFIYLVLISRYFSSMVLSILIFSLSILWNTEIDGDSLKVTFKKLGIGSKGFLRNAIIGVVSTFFLVYPLILVEALTFILSGIGEPAVVPRVVGNFPLYLAIFSFTIAPVFEETFFRGFLMRRIGIIPSSLLFALAHIGYGSLFELVGAFTIGIVFSLIYKRTNSLVTNIFSHATVNFITVAVVYYLRYVGGVPL